MVNINLVYIADLPAFVREAFYSHNKLANKLCTCKICVLCASFMEK